MLQGTKILSPLFTFAPDKLQPQLSQIRKKKFPFINKAKVKKLTSYHKIQTQELDHFSTCENQQQNSSPPLKIAPQTSQRKYHNTIPERNSLECQSSLPPIVDPEAVPHNKLGLPSVFHKKFHIRSNSKQKRSISSQPRVRDRYQEKNIQGKEKNNNAEFQESCHSAMLRKLQSGESKEMGNEKMEKIQQNGHRKIWKKSSLAVNIAAIDNKIIEGINRMKKIYN